MKDKKQTILDQISEILNSPVTIVMSKITSGSEKAEQGRFELKSEKKTIAYFDLVTLPGCCGVIVSMHSHVTYQHRQKGIGALLNTYRILQAKEWGYGAIICTDISTNHFQNRILEKNKWLNIAQFNNPRTGNDVNIHFIDLND